MLIYGIIELVLFPLCIVSKKLHIFLFLQQLSRMLTDFYNCGTVTLE